MKALHMAQREDFTGDTGLDLTPFDLIVCNPAIGAGTISAAQIAGRIKHEAKLFGSTNAHMLGYWTNNSYYNSLLTALNKHLLKDKNGDLVRHHTYNTVYLMPTPGMYRDYAHWLIEYSKYHIYIDDCTRDYPNSKWGDVQPHLPNMTYDQWNTLYQDGQATFQAILAGRPENLLVIANTAGWVIPTLDGICIERGHHRRLKSIVALARFVAQWNTTPNPYNVDWYGSWEMPPLVYKGIGIDSLPRQ